MDVHPSLLHHVSLLMTASPSVLCSWEPPTAADIVAACTVGTDVPLRPEDVIVQQVCCHLHKAYKLYKLPSAHLHLASTCTLYARQSGLANQGRAALLGC